LIRRQLGNNFGDFFYFHGAQYSTGWGLVQRRIRPWRVAIGPLYSSIISLPLSSARRRSRTCRISRFRERGDVRFQG
jgi:hypothetical protein